MSDNKTKKEGVCPTCGQQNYELPTYERQKVLNELGIEHYITFSFVKYKCTRCKTIWTERWDFDF